MEISWLEASVLFTTAIVSLIAYIKWNYRYWERRNVPYLQPTFPMGNFEAPWTTENSTHITLSNICKQLKAKGHKYGGIFTTLRPAFVPLDLDLLKCILIKDFQYFIDRGLYHNEEADPLSANIFAIEGNKWRSLRTKISPTFTSGKMKYMFQTVMDCGAALEAEIEKLYVKKEPVDIKEMAALFTTNVIGSCAFGLDCDAFANPNNEFRYHTRKFIGGSLFSVLRTFVTLTFPNLSKKLGVLTMPKSASQFYIDVVKNITEARESGAVKRNDFIQLLVDIKTGAKKSENSITFNEIAAQSFLFFLAGFETSASTMTFAFYELAKHQDIQDKVREEIRRVAQNHGGKITYEGITEMTYLGQVFDETLRKYPILATLVRIVTKDYKVPGEALVLKKGTHVFISLHAIHNDPEYFPNPEKFDPDRFLPENKLNRHTCAYMPFGEGPRNCIGLRFGIMQAKIGMALMLRNYRYTTKMSKIEFSTKSLLLLPVGEVSLDIEKVN